MLTIILVSFAVLLCVSLWVEFRRPNTELVPSEPVRLGDSDAELKIRMGQTVEYSHSVHGSVGFEYSMEFDPDAFVMDRDFRYDNPEKVAAGMCGADSAVKTCCLRSLRKGRHTVKVVHKFRGSIERVVTFTIKVV